MYTYKAKRKNKAAAVTVALSSAASAVLLLLGPLFGVLRAYSEVLGLVVLSFAILVAGRYLLKDFVYMLGETEDGDCEFTVIEVQGKRRTAVCRIALSEIDGAFVETPEERGAIKERLRETKRYDYCPDLLPYRSLYLLFSDRDRAVSVRIEPDEKMEELILRLSDSLRARRMDGEEEEA